MSILSVLNPSLVIADGVTLLEKGTPAPYTGILFTPEESQAMYEQFETYKEKITSLEKINSLYKNNELLYEEKVNLLLEQNTTLTDSLSKIESNKDLTRIIWFGLGMLSVGLGMYGAKTISGN